MQTKLDQNIKATEAGKEADLILRNCVHCGFCTATCPTYQELGDELDGPRGRIYLIKQMLEGNKVTKKTQMHLDRCLTCRSCETTCPSGVQYGKLIEIGRAHINKIIKRPLHEQLLRKLLRVVLPYPKRLSALVRIGNIVKPLLPAQAKRIIPDQQIEEVWLSKNHARQMLMLDGCAQTAIKAGTNNAARKIFDKLGIKLISPDNAGCCGAVSYHLTEHEEGRTFMRNNIDAWWPAIENGCEAIIINASGCGAMVKEYGDILKNDPTYSGKAKKISQLAKDPSEILAIENLVKLKIDSSNLKIAFQTPCTLQHAQQLNGNVETILKKIGFKLTPVNNAHLCCGSAGTYSIFQEKMSKTLLTNKMTELLNGKPDVIATANIGCQLHLESEAKIPVKHWLEILAENIN